MQTFKADLLKGRHQNLHYLECMTELKRLFKILPNECLDHFNFKVFSPFLDAQIDENSEQLRHELIKLVASLNSTSDGVFQVEESDLLKSFFQTDVGNEYEKLLGLRNQDGAELTKYADYFNYWRNAISPKGNHADNLLVNYVSQIHEEYRKLLSVDLALWLKVNPTGKAKLRFSGPFEGVFKDEKRSPNSKLTANKLTSLTCFAFGEPVNEKSISDFMRSRANAMNETYQDDI